MIKLLLRRCDETADSTLSTLWALDPTDDSVYHKFLGFVIEDGYRAVKEAGLTRIPAGTYKLLKRQYGGFYERYKAKWNHAWVPELQGVPGFKDILIHVGNEVPDTRGCLLINSTAGYDNQAKVFKGFASGLAYQGLYAYLADQWTGGVDAYIEIVR